MPSLFIGHGSPMNAVEDTDAARAWTALGAVLPRPKSIIVVSAHWYRRGTAATVSPTPRTIHDFGGFPEELYQVQYPAPGDPALARRAAERLAPAHVELDADWGLDHGAWSVLRRLFPDASVPTIQIAVDATAPTSSHLELGRRLAPLRAEGVLVVGSGNVVHNLRAYDWSRSGGAPYDWTVRFDALVRERLASSRADLLADPAQLGPDFALAHPSPDHYLPLLYAAGAAQGEPVSFPYSGFEGRSISMLSVLFGGAA